MLAHRWTAVILASGLAFAASAATVTWTGGGATANWSDAGNWVGGVTPATGDTLVFQSGAGSNNDLASTTYASISFNGFTGCIGGSAFALSAATPIATSGTGGCIISAVNFVAPTATLNNAGKLQLRGMVTGNGLTQAGAGTTELWSPLNDYTGPTRAASGTLSLPAREVIRDASDLTVDTGATLFSNTRETVRGVSLQGTWNVAVRGPAAGQYGQLFPSGGIALAGPLVVTSLAPIVPGTVLTIIDNRLGGPVSGKFAGLAEGATFLAGVNRFQISYVGGTGDDVTLTSLPITAAFDVQDMWWAGPAENGWGMSILQHDDKLFVVLYAYDDAGRPTWYVMPAGAWNADHNAYSGTLYSTRATPYFAYDTTQFFPGFGVGPMTITFTDPDHARIDYTISDTAGTKFVKRQLFGPPATTTVDVGDMWWGGTYEKGWGIAILQQYASLFIVWFTYDATGSPTWFVMPTVNLASDGSYNGHVYRTTGSPWLGQPYDPTKLQVIDAGTFTLLFSGDFGTFAYNVDGHNAILSLTRQKF